MQHVSLTAFTVTHYYQVLSRGKGCTKGWVCKRAPQGNNTYNVQSSNMYKIQHRQLQNTKLSKVIQVKKESAEVQRGQFVVGYL